LTKAPRSQSATSRAPSRTTAQGGGSLGPQPATPRVRAVAVIGLVSDPESWTAARDLIDARHGRLDILVNNAGIIHVTTIAEETLAAWNHLLSVNLTGAFLGLHTMLPLLRRGERPAVVNTSSIFGPSGAIGYSAYAASKAGLLGLTRTAATKPRMPPLTSRLTPSRLRTDIT
jgi:NAD(P)-dependent dehydrogenase (short-subunit alcohol dehydrogenase family)